jgi:hypothetical protein
LEVVKMQDLAWLLIERMLGIGLHLTRQMQDRLAAASGVAVRPVLAGSGLHRRCTGNIRRCGKTCPDPDDQSEAADRPAVPEASAGILGHS